MAVRKQITQVLKKNLKKGLAQAILTAISLPRARATSVRCCRYLNEQPMVKRERMDNNNFYE
jgi:hypothetical protein